MDQFNFLTDEDLVKFFHCKKTEISCIEEPHIFLNQLRDHNLIPEDLYKKVIKMKGKVRKQAGVYQILDLLENKREQNVRLFWRCVFQDHIQQKYPVLRLLRNSLLDGSFMSYETLPSAEKSNRNKSVERQEKERKQKKCTGKRKKSGEESDEEEPDPSFVSSQKKPVMEPTLSQLLKKGELPVTCGDEEGTLYPEKLAKGEKCFLSQDRWFTPCDFERFSGMGNSKKWKDTIRYRNIPLRKLIERGFLQCPCKFRAYGRKKVTFSSVRVKNSSPQSISSVETEESSKDLGELMEEEEDREQEEEEEEDGEPVDLSEFQAFVLPVSCGSVKGLLHKKRFAGPRSKSIRTEERWFTPQGFVKQEFPLTDGCWKKNILCHGKTLLYLVKKKILQVHSLLCLCHLCCPENEQDQDNDDVCYSCNSDGNLVCCDECPRAFHHDCHLPVLKKETLGDKWICTYCVLKTNQRLWIPMSKEGALSCPVSENIMHCEYLLLILYKADTKHVFTHNPTETKERCSSMISTPMCLNTVKSNLQQNKYRTVRQFVNDIKHVFNNCQTFNGDNNYGRIAGEMRKKFEKEFNTVFKIQ